MEADEKVNLLANHFEIKFDQEWNLHQYEVNFEPDIDSKRVKFALLMAHESLFPNRAFDGRILYTTTRLPDDVSPLFSAVFSTSKVQAFQLLQP